MRRLIFLLSLFFLSCLNGSHASWSGNVREVVLSNGMKFLLVSRGNAPIFSAFVRFRAGGIEEEEGKGGLAHLLEHMAFKGTQTIGTLNFEEEKKVLEEIERTGEELSAEYGKGKKADARRIKDLRERLRDLHREEEKHIVKEEVSKRMLEEGGEGYNATTSKDMTTYYVSLPSDKLSFWAAFESERIFRPVFREFYEERDVVIEERRMRVDDDPDGRLYEAFLATAFEKSPYRRPTIGTSGEILRLTLKDLASFRSRYYVPSNAVGTLVGRFDPDEAIRILEKTFGAIRPDQLRSGVEGGTSPLVGEDVPKGQEGRWAPSGFAGGGGDASPHDDEPPQQGERRLTLKMDARPRLWIGYHKPTLPHDDDYLFDLLNEIAASGRSSRLYRRLVLKEKVVSHVEGSTGVPGARLPNLFLIEIDLLSPHLPEGVLRLVDDEIEKLRTEEVSARELAKAKNRLTASLLWRMKTNEHLASELSYFETVGGNWRYLAGYLGKIGSFEAADLRQLATVYLQRSNRTIAILQP